MDRLIDVAGLLQAARNDMKVGQMIHGEAFSLFEAMSALEAGNPKMDAAASPAADRPTLEALLADLDSTAPLAELGEAGLLAVLDQLLAMEASWHTGSSAMQTVYGCLYMLRMDRVKAHGSAVARALYAFCRALQCDCATVRDLIIKGGVCEEEDMNLLVGGIPFEPPEGADAEALAALDAAIAEQAQLGRAAEEARLTGSSSGGGSSGGAVHTAVGLRLQLRRALHVGLREAGSDDPAEVVASAALFKGARELLPQVRESASLAAPPPQANGAAAATAPAPSASSSASPKQQQQQQQPQLPPGFYVDANRHLLGPAPPRQVQIMSLADSLSYFDRLFDHLALAVVVSEHAWDYRSLQLHVWRFARLKPAVVARSVLHWLISPDRWQNIRTSEEASSSASTSTSGGGAGRGRGGKGGRGGKAGGAAGTGSNGAPAQPALPAWVPSKAMIAGACQVAVKSGLPEEVDMFLEQAVIAASNWFQALLMNRCRCRRRLRRCLEDWLNMFHHGFNADVLPAFHDHLRAGGWRWRPIEGAEDQGPFSTWVEYETAATMLHHLLMGFELELYEPREYDMIVWYCDYLCSQAVSTGRELVMRAPAPAPPQLPGGLGGRGAGGRGGRGLGRGLGSNKDAAAAALAMARFEKSQAQHRYELVELEAFQLMCSGLVRLLVGLRVAGSIPEPPFPPPFNDGVQRFDQRFGAFFTLVRPAPLSHAEFVESMNPGDRDARFLFALASRAFAEARARCAALKTLAPSPEVAEGWVRGLDRAAAMNQVVSGVLAAKAAEGGKIAWTCDFSHHPYFPAVTLPKPTAAAPAAAKEGAEKK